MRDGSLLGGQMLGPGVEHPAHILSEALRDGLAASAPRDRTFYHPTFEKDLGRVLSEIIQMIDRS